MRLIESHKYGPVHRFGDHHVYRALIHLSDGKRRGRKALAESIGVGEGSIRTILEFLREKNFVDIRQTGIQITKNGEVFLKEIPLDMKEMPRTDISLGEINVAVHVRKAASAVKTGIEQRDSAIKAGADGATTIIVKGGKLVIPPDFDLDESKPEESDLLKKMFDLEEGDVVIIGTAKNIHDAENGALAAALDLL